MTKTFIVSAIVGALLILCCVSSSGYFIYDFFGTMVNGQTALTDLYFTPPKEAEANTSCEVYDFEFDQELFNPKGRNLKSMRCDWKGSFISGIYDVDDDEFMSVVIIREDACTANRSFLRSADFLQMAGYPDFPMEYEIFRNVYTGDSEDVYYSYVYQNLFMDGFLEAACRNGTFSLKVESEEFFGEGFGINSWDVEDLLRESEFDL